MPLLHKAPYQFRSVPSDIKDEDEVFHIRATKEIFKTYDEYISKAQLYTKEVWSCCLTGKSSLTLEEALESEGAARARLGKFPCVLEKPTLLLAHHSQRNLDWMATTLTSQYRSHCAVGEIVSVVSGEEKKTGKVLECVTSLEAEDSDMYSYKIMLLGTGEQLQLIPHSKIERKLTMPSKELIKMFIREHTHKQSNMFNVKKEMLIKHNIPHKFASITSVLRTPKSDKSEVKKKGPKIINNPKIINKPSSATKTKPKSTPPPKAPKSGPKMIKIHSVGDDGRLITTWKQVPVKPTPKSPPRIIEEVTILSDSESGGETTTLDKPKKPPLTEEQKKEQRQKRKSQKEVREFTKKVKSLVEKYKDQITAKGDNASKNLKQTSLLSYTNKDSISATIREIIEAEDNGYRRSMIVNDLAKCMTDNVKDKLPLATPVKSLLLEKREKLLEKDKMAVMTLAQREVYMREKEEMRIAELQRKREERMAENARLKEERMQQRDAEREVARQKRLAQQALERIVIDDLTLEDSNPLPVHIPLELPEGVPASAFPEVALIADAIHFFKGVFTQPEDDINYNSDLILQASCEGPRGHKVLSNLLVNMLQTLGQELRDKIKIPLLEVPLNSVDFSEHNVGASVLVYITYLLQKEGYRDAQLDDIAQTLQQSEFHQLAPSNKIHLLAVMCNEIFKTGTFNSAIQDNIDRATLIRKQIQAEAVLRNKQKQDKKLKQMQDTLKKGLVNPVQQQTPLHHPDTSPQSTQVSTESIPPLPDKVSAQAIPPLPDKVSAQAIPQLADKVSTKTIQHTDKVIPVISPGGVVEGQGENDRDGDGDEGIGSGEEEEEITHLAATVKSRQDSIKRKKEEEEEKRDKEERERIKEQKFREQQAKIQNQRNKEEKLKQELETLVLSIRNEPLGMDRNYSKYWIFHGTPGLYIEQGWWAKDYFSVVDKKGGSLDTSNNSSEGSEDSGVNTHQEPVSVPPETSRSWFMVPNLHHYEELKTSLNKRGTREKGLLASLLREDERIKTAIRKLNYPSRPPRLVGTVETTIKAIKKEVITMDSSLGYAGLGGLENINKFVKQDLPSVTQISEVLLEIQESVDAKYMKKPMCSTFNTDLTFTYNKNVQVWRDLVSAAATYSDLHMLLSLFDNCVKWEKSLDNIKCKSCKKKGDEKKLLICDVCDTGYHCGCLRPPLKKVPQGDWLCPDCEPEPEEEDSEESDEAASEAEDEGSDTPEGNDDFCCVCDTGGELILCDKCPSAYHPLCHDPPLRRIPRGDWACYKCLNNSGSEEEEEEEEEEDEQVEDCSVCGKGGDLLACQECESTFHMRCHNPPVRAVPGRTWRCSLCRPPPANEQKKRSSSNSAKGRASKKRKVEKRPKARVEQLKSEDEAETTETDTESDEDRRSSARATRRSGARSRGAGPEDLESREERSNRRAATRGVSLETCEKIITDLLKIPESADFIDLVDKKKVPDYYDLIENPICLSRIKEKTLYLQYDTCEEFVDDILTLLDNCFSYNLEQSEVYENGRVLETSFLSLIKSRLPAIHKNVKKNRRKSG